MTDPSKYIINHTCLRVADPKVSVPFYEKNFGMTLLRKISFPEKEFDLYMLAFDQEKSPNKGAIWTDRRGVLELCYNYGSENSFKANNGNEEPHRGFGHICWSVEKLEVACKQLEANGVKFKKRLSDGRQKDIAFALDPDGYWIELIENAQVTPSAGESVDLSSYRFNHSMVRVRDPKASLDFYINKLGMTLLRTSEHENAKFTLYFLAYPTPEEKAKYTPDAYPKEVVSGFEGILELTWNWGTESDPDFKGYHNGNTDPKGFGHIGIAVDNGEEACKSFAAKGVPFNLEWNKGFIPKIAFIRDPDGYAVEVFERDFNLA